MGISLSIDLVLIFVLTQNHGLASSAKVDPAFSSTNSTSVTVEHKGKVRDNERDIHSNDAKHGEVGWPPLFNVPRNIQFVAIQLTGLSSRRSFTRQKDSLQVPNDAVADVPLPIIAPDAILPTQGVRAVQGPSKTQDIPKPTEPAQPVTRPYTTRTDHQHLSHVTHPSMHLATTRPTSDRPQVDLPSSMPEPPMAVAHASALARHVSFAEVPSFSITVPKDVEPGALRNTQPVTNAQTSSLYNLSSLVPTQNDHVQTYGQPDTSKPVDTLSRHNVTSTESHHYHTISTQKSVNLMPPVSNRPQPSLTAPIVPEPLLPLAHTNTSSRHGSTTEPPSLRNTSNSQAAVVIGQKAPLIAQNQSNHTQTQVCQSGA